MKALLAIDQSTSATKAIVFDTEGNVLSRASRDHRQIHPRPGWVEHDPEEIWQNTLDACRNVLAGAPKAEISGVCITNQRETILAFDRATGRPLMNALVWQDRRGDAICTELRTAGHDPAVNAKTGLKIDSYFSASKIAWMMRHAPEVAGAVRAGSGAIGTIDSYLVHRLTNGKTFATDSTNASRTLLFDIRAMGWDVDLCALFDCPIDALPEVRDATARFGETTLGGLLASPVPVCGVIGDSQAALFAHRCFNVGEGKVTLGTGSSVLLNLGHELPDASD
ncbi:MAG TPA: FGGY family carbohydrate kinase, partial [Tepidisphaeraceae bacterium]|nr:FGGY family carbohydrate kinase [Tepidisphaeraceae bacterium]